MRRAWAYCGVNCAVWCVAAVSATFLVSAQDALASTTRGHILSLAEQQLGYLDHGDYCTKFGPCETWCSLFVTWVWRHAGVPVPRLAFTGYLYDWAQATTAVEGARGVPAPGDAVLFGTGPSSVSTSLHTGIVEAVYPGYLVTIEGDSLHGVRRYVVPLRDPQLVGEPGPIYAYASPLGRGGNRGSSGGSAAVAAFPALPRAIIARQRFAPLLPLERRRLLRAIAALRAFQHMPYRTAHVLINWIGVNSRGLVEVRVTSAMPVSYARRAWQAFLHRFGDAGQAYTVSFQAPPDPPVDRSAPFDLWQRIARPDAYRVARSVVEQPNRLHLSVGRLRQHRPVVFGNQRRDRPDLHADCLRRWSHDSGARGCEQPGWRRPARDLRRDRRRSRADVLAGPEPAGGDLDGQGRSITSCPAHEARRRQLAPRPPHV